MLHARSIRHIDMMLKVSVLPLTEIDYIDIDILSKEDNDRKKLIYPILNKYASIYSLDEIDLYWNLFYPQKEINEIEKVYGNKDIYFFEILRQFSKTFLAHRDGRIVFKYWDTQNNKYFKAHRGISKVLLWNSLNRYFTTDILGVMYLIDNNMGNERYLKGYYSKVSLEDMQLESILKKGTAETHLHVSASTDFYTSWKNLMNIYQDQNQIAEYNKVIGSKPYSLNKYYIIASIFRLIMTFFLKNHNDICLECFINHYTDDINCIGRVENCLKVREMLDAIRKKKKIHELFDEEELKNIFKSLFEEVFKIKTVTKNEETSGLKNNPRDILDYILFNSNCGFENHLDTYTENIFLMKSINYILKNNKDLQFSDMFINYLRIKNEFFSLMVQGNQIKGLDNFVDYFSKSTKLGRNIDTRICWEERFKSQFKDKNLKKLEIRISPLDVYKNSKTKQFNKDSKIRNDTCKQLISIFEAYKKILEEEGIYFDLRGDKCYKTSMPIPHLGIIYHFIKKNDIPVDKKCWFDYQKEKERENLYYEQLKNEYQLQAEAIIKVRNKIPQISKYIIGIDGASIENNTDPWVFASVYEKLRNSDHSMYNENFEPLTTLGFTFHAGEDFRHILTGLRRIDETIDRYKYHAGDRIGHGIAVGVDIETWIDRHPVVTMPRMEHLENMLWIWGSCKYSNNSIDMGYLERKIMDAAKEIYINISGITIYNLWEAYESKFKPFTEYKNNIRVEETKLNCNSYDLEDTICCSNLINNNGMWSKEKLIRANHCRRYLENMLEPIQVEVCKENAYIIEEMQKKVRKKISNRGIIIETNPTSNASIGEIENIFNHYILKLNKIENGEDIESLMISINTDDPSVFNTNLSNEFAYIFYSLVDRGYSKEKILRWIDKIREHGMNSSFIRDCSEDVKEVIEELTCIIDKLKNY